MNKINAKKRAVEHAKPEWFKPEVYEDWMKGVTAGELLIEMMSRVTFLSDIETNISDFNGSLEMERDHFLKSIETYGLVKWSSNAKKAELKANAKAIYSPLKPVAIDDVLMAIKRIQSKKYKFTFSQNLSGETILASAQMRNHPVDTYVPNEMWLKIDLRDLSSDQFAIEAKLYSLLFSERFSQRNKKFPISGRDYAKLFKKMITFNPLAYLDLIIWSVLCEDAFSKQNVVNYYFEAMPNLYRADPESFFSRTVNDLMRTMLGVEASGKVVNDIAIKKLAVWLTSLNADTGCSFASILLVEF